MAKKTAKKTLEQLEAEAIKAELVDLSTDIKNGLIPHPTRIFNVGDPVKVGALENAVITEVLFNGLAYRIHYDYMGKEYGRPTRIIGDGIWKWIDVFPMSSYLEGVPLRVDDNIRINYFNNDIDSLLHKVYNAGVDFNPGYQRELVWTDIQKTDLITSIFNNVDIGKFTFIKHDSGRELFYEILDGKQRLSTICEYYEDRFAWNNLRFSELCFEDAHHFTGFPVVQGECEHMTEQQIYKLFVRLNTSGIPQSKEHLNKIKQLINE